MLMIFSKQAKSENAHPALYKKYLLVTGLKLFKTTPLLPLHSDEMENVSK